MRRALQSLKVPEFPKYFLHGILECITNTFVMLRPSQVVKAHVTTESGFAAGASVCCLRSLVASVDTSLSAGIRVHVWRFSARSILVWWRFRLSHPVQCRSVNVLSARAVFLPGSARLLVSDPCRNCVHVLDAATRCHIGFLSRPGNIEEPRSIAVHGALVAIIAGAHEIRLFQECGDVRWQCLRTIQMQQWSCRTYNMRFTYDGLFLVIPGASATVDVVQVSSGLNVFQLTCPTQDIEQVQGGWLVCGKGQVVHTATNNERRNWTPVCCIQDCFYTVKGLAMVRGFGLIVVQATKDNRLCIFGDADQLAMMHMSPMRVAFMSAVA